MRPWRDVIWARDVWEPHCRPVIRHWVREAGYEEMAIDGAPEAFGVGVAGMVRTLEPFPGGIRFTTPSLA